MEKATEKIGVEEAIHILQTVTGLNRGADEIRK